MIAVVDYGMGNVRSVAKALEHVAPDADVRISASVTEIDSAERIVFPGQGAIRDCMRNLRESGLEAAVRRATANKPVLAVCIGEQMLFEHSEEADTQGLGVFAGRVVRFAEPKAPAHGCSRLKVPHMGWNRVRQSKPHALWQGVDDGAWFYFVHSYFAVPAQNELVAGDTDYGGVFTCAVARDNIFATQFHPEKSAAAGLAIYENFTRWNP